MQLGKFEHAVLSAVAHLGEENAYGTPIWRVVDYTLGKTTSVGALYTTLERLTKKGLLETFMGPILPERGGKARRYFRLTGMGQSSLDESNAAVERVLKPTMPLPIPGLQSGEARG